MQTDKEFEDFFRERLNGLEETPPPNAWNKIQADIKPARTYYRELAAVALLCLLSIVIFLGLKNQPESTSEAGLASATLNQPTSAEQTAAATNLSAEKQNSTSEVQSAQIADPEIRSAAPAMEENSATRKAESNEPENETDEAYVTSNGKTLGQTPKNHLAHIGAGISVSGKDRPATSLTAEKEEKNQPETTTKAAKNSLNAGLLASTAAKKRYALTEKTISANEAKTTFAGTETANVQAAATSAKDQNSGIVRTTTPAALITTETKPQTNLSAESLVAQNTSVRTDSVALPAIPQMPADSVKKQNENLARNLPEEKSSKGRFAVTVNFTPGVIARRLIANQADETYLRFTETKKGTNSALGFDLSATLHHRINPKTTIDGSFSFTKLHSQVNYQIATSDLQVVSSSNVPGNNAADVKVGYTFADEEFKNEFAYGGIRAGVSYELLQSASHAVFVSGGAGLNMLMSNRGELQTTYATTTGTATENTTTHNAFHTVNSHVYVSCGLEKAVMPRVSLLMAPSFTYYLNSALVKKHIFEMKPYTFGLNFGLRYQL